MSNPVRDYMHFNQNLDIPNGNINVWIFGRINKGTTEKVWQTVESRIWHAVENRVENTIADIVFDKIVDDLSGGEG